MTGREVEIGEKKPLALTSLAPQKCELNPRRTERLVGLANVLLTRIGALLTSIKSVPMDGAPRLWRLLSGRRREKMANRA